MKGNWDQLDTGKGLGQLTGRELWWNLGLYEYLQRSNLGKSVKWVQTTLVGLLQG